MRYLYPYIFTLIYWISYFIFINVESARAAVFPLFLLFAIATLIIINRRDLFRYWNLWINLLIFFASSFGILLIFTHPTARNLHVILFGVICGSVIYTVQHFARESHIMIAKRYLHFLGFVFVIALWQSVAVLYFIIISYNASIWSATLIVAFLTFFLGRGIIITHGLKRSSEMLVLLVLTLTTAELYHLIWLLPLHYYVLAALVTSWFYFIIEMVLSGQDIQSRKLIFRLYSTILIIVVILLLITASWS
jgi:hypothetical protein